LEFPAKHGVPVMLAFPATGAAGVSPLLRQAERCERHEHYGQSESGLHKKSPGRLSHASG
jgi:hypothetical protein